MYRSLKIGAVSVSVSATMISNKLQKLEYVYEAAGQNLSAQRSDVNVRSLHSTFSCKDVHFFGV